MLTGVSEPGPSPAPVHPTACLVLTKKMARVQEEIVEYLRYPTDRRDQNYLTDSRMLRVALSDLTVFAEELLTKGRQ